MVLITAKFHSVVELVRNPMEFGAPEIPVGMINLGVPSEII
jgi:hypothetical protein